MLNSLKYLFKRRNMYLLNISFNGRNYHGWQYQENAVSVQGVLKKTVSDIFKLECPYPSGCSRTDTGVHALEFIVTVPELRNIPPDSFRLGLNSFLPEDIRVNSVKIIEGFSDGREFVFGKHYRYMICLKKTASPWAFDMSWHSGYPLDVEKMKQALAHFNGTHDFAGFMGTGSDVKTTVRTIRQSGIFVKDGYMAIDFTGEGFLKQQIRIICGTLVSVGRGRLSPGDIPALIEAKDRSLVPHTLPGKGLFLYKVFSSTEEMLNYKFPETFEGMIW